MHDRGIFSIFFYLLCVPLELPHRGDSNAYTQYTTFDTNIKITLNYPEPTAVIFFQGTQEQIRNSRGIRAILL